MGQKYVISCADLDTLQISNGTDRIDLQTAIEVCLRLNGLYPRTLHYPKIVKEVPHEAD